MSYDLHFVGLVCFTRFVAGLDALLPDGRNFEARHLPAIVSAPEAVLDSDWWGSEDEHAAGVFRIDNDPGPLPPQSIAVKFPGTGQPGKLNAAEWSFLPNLHTLDSAFKLSKSPDTIATTRLMNGTFSVREHPKGEAVVSTLSLPHDGVIRVEASGRFIRFKAGTELVLANVGEGYLEPLLVPARSAITVKDARTRDERDGGDARDDRNNDYYHFQIYNQLAETHGLALPVPPLKSRQKLASKHPIFTKIIRQLKIGCSNTGCC